MKTDLLGEPCKACGDSGRFRFKGAVYCTECFEKKRYGIIPPLHNERGNRPFHRRREPEGGQGSA